MSFGKNQIIAIAAVAIIIVAAASIFFIGGGEEPSTYDEGDIVITTNVQDKGEITQVFKEAPERIVAGNNTVLEMLLYFGLGDKIVAAYYDEDEIWDQEPVKSEYKKLIDRLDPKYHSSGLLSQAVITEVQPDLIMGYKSSFGEGKWAVGSTEYWNKMGCNVWSLNTQAGKATVEGMAQDYADFGLVFDIKDKTDSFMSKYNAALDKASNSGIVTGILEYRGAENGFSAYGDKAFIGQELLACGGVNKFASGGTVGLDVFVDSTDMEALVLIAFGSNGSPDEVAELIKSNPNYQYIPAVKNGKILAIGLSETYGGVRALTTIEGMVALLG